MVEGGEGVEKVAVGRCGWGSAKDSPGRKQQRKAGVRELFVEVKRWRLIDAVGL